MGGTGSLGQALIRQLRPDNEVFIASRDELKQWTMRNHLKDEGVRFLVCDMRDRQRLEEVVLTCKPHMVIVAAALKQVDTCERAPSESIKTNILGVQNLVEVVDRSLDRLGDLEAVVMVSTDKACEPTNVYGMSKAIAERIVTSRSELHKHPRFVAVRYGNVLESRGSIIPLFRYQAEHGHAFTLTHPDMTRFVMTLDESINLILRAATQAKSGETWIPRLRSMRVQDLAEIFSEQHGKPLEIIGMRPGEKLHEMLVSQPESLRTRTAGDLYVIASSLERPPDNASSFSYGSDHDVLGRADLERYLGKLGVLTGDMDRFVGISVDEIRKD